MHTISEPILVSGSEESRYRVDESEALGNEVHHSSGSSQRMENRIRPYFRATETKPDNSARASDIVVSQK